MAKNVINRGSTANDGTGDNLRAGANKINLNFDEIYTAIGDGTNINGTIKVADDSSTITTISANGETLKILGGTGITSTISGNNLTLAVDGTIITGSSTTTLTNKTINGPDNTITNIANSSLANNSVTVSDGSNTSPVALGGTLTFAGTANEVNVVENAGTVTIGMPDNVVITGNLTVNGTTTTVNSSTIEITNSFTFEGTTSDNFETTLSVIDPTADRTVNLPNESGTVVLQSSTDTLTNKTISNASITGSTGTINLTSTDNRIRSSYAGTGALPNNATYEGMFAWDSTGNAAYVADNAGWIKLITENDGVGALSNVNISGVADGNGLIWSSAQGRFNAGSLPSTGFSIAMAVAL
tara:strand:+ start:1033 stop:2100 length:1068 start_codon:yes stop_codon:yes gene_type:complete